MILAIKILKFYNWLLGVTRTGVYTHTQPTFEHDVQIYYIYMSHLYIFSRLVFCTTDRKLRDIVYDSLTKKEKVNDFYI